MIEYVNALRVPACDYPMRLGQLLGQENQPVVDPKAPHTRMWRATTGRLCAVSWNHGGYWITVAESGSEVEEHARKIRGHVRWVEVLDADGNAQETHLSTHVEAPEGVFEAREALFFFDASTDSRPEASGNTPHVVQVLRHLFHTDPSRKIQILKGHETWHRQL